MISALFPAEVKTFEADPRCLVGRLYPQEEAYVAKAVEKRRLEFSAGRVGARRLLEELNITNFPIGMGPQREPLWPQGVTGSIAHTEGLCGVVVARQDRILSLGLDVERLGRLSDNAWHKVSSREESGSVINVCGDAVLAKALIFSAKECVYKCQYPVSRQWLDFKDVRVSVDVRSGMFKALVMKDIKNIADSGEFLEGRFAFQGNFVYTGMTLFH